ncbi:MAG: hypothetical protein AAGA35_02280 [Patescibacteria group bacterium]
MTKNIFIPTIALGVFIVGLFAVGSYDPRNELTILTPDAVEATNQGGLEIPDLATPSLDVPELEAPEIEVPEVEPKELEVPELEVPAAIEVPELETPKELDVPSLDTPSLTVPTLDIPSLGIPSLDIPDLDIPDLDIPDNDHQSVSHRFCRVRASSEVIYVGNSVTISWDTKGYDSIYLNGELVSGDKGSRTYTNVQVNTTYKLEAKSADGKHKCNATVYVQCLPPVAKHPECTLTPKNQTIDEGDRASFTWTTTNADTVTLTDFGSVALNDSGTTDPLFSDQRYTLTATGYSKQVQCHANVHVRKENPEPPSCPLLPEDGRIIIDFADERIRSNQDEANSRTSIVDVNVPAGTYDVTLVGWDGYIGRENVTQPNERYVLGLVTPSGTVTTNSHSDIPDRVREALVNEQVQTGFVLNEAATGAQGIHAVFPDTSSPNSLQPICGALDPEPVEPAPSCDLFEVNPQMILRGGTATLTWETTNTNRVVINNGVGEVDEDGSLPVTPLEDTTYILTAFGTNGQQDSCEVTLKVEDETNPVPECVAFGADRTSLPIGGGDVELSWETLRADNVEITPIVGSVDGTGTTSVNVTSDTVFTLTASQLDGDQNACTVAIDVEEDEPTPISCAANVSFTISDTSINRGQSVTLDWTTTGITSLSISGLTSTDLTGSETVSPDVDTTFVMTATDGVDTITCPVSVDVSSGGGGGGGGSSSPRCELDISDTSITRGEEITLRWETSRTNDIIIEDDRGNVIISTDDLLGDDKDELLDGSITLRPDRDTEYTLTAERGRRDRECRVEVEVENDVTVIEIRDQQPLVAGISLAATPYTGFEAGPILTFIFYALLIAWALFVTYILVIRRDSIAGFSLAAAPVIATETREQHEINPDLFVRDEAPEETEAPVVASVAAPTVPSNLPTGTPTIGYANYVETEEVALDESSDARLSALEDLAHEHKVLLSSDAIRHFVSAFPREAERVAHMEELITAAKATFPAEDGWVVINKTRMGELCKKYIGASAKSDPTAAKAVPTGTSSLAEAIVTGNVTAAYQMIGNRPMFSLADAAADLDALYRKRHGSQNVVVSQLLEGEGNKFSDEQLKAAIAALTSALDGTYSTEEEAVKMSIMKAVKALS